MRSRAAPSHKELRGARELFERIEYPMLMHCKSGADRAGLMSVLYRHFKEGIPIAQAKRELSLRYGHIRQADTGILDYFFERYLRDAAACPIEFGEWIETSTTRRSCTERSTRAVGRTASSTACCAANSAARASAVPQAGPTASAPIICARTSRA